MEIVLITEGSSAWVLTDRYGSQYGDHKDPEFFIYSTDQLRVALENFAQQEPRVLILDSLDGFRVMLNLGGSLAAVTAFVGGDVNTILSAVVGTPHAIEEKCFIGDWQPYCVPPNELLPVGEVIAIALELYQSRRPPEWVKWESW